MNEKHYILFVFGFAIALLLVFGCSGQRSQADSQASSQKPAPAVPSSASSGVSASGAADSQPAVESSDAGAALPEEKPSDVSLLDQIESPPAVPDIPAEDVFASPV